MWFQDDFLKPLSSLTHLEHLNLGLDLEISAGDSLREDHDFAWYRRCFLWRYSESEKIATVCSSLEHCEWTHLRKDSEGNDQQHDFVIREEAGNRVVRPMMQWWMADQYKNSFGAPLGPLPDLLVPENPWWEHGMVGKVWNVSPSSSALLLLRRMCKVAIDSCNFI
jgi:hypothetical protein